LFFRFFAIFSVFLELSVDGVELKCRYDRYSDYRCYVLRADFSMKTIGANFTFSGSQEQKQTTIEIKFYRSGRVAHLPLNLFEVFPNLIELSIKDSDIPILGNNFFKPEHNKLRRLVLNMDKIKIIEENAFEHLTNLEWINLEDNKIKMISPGTFKNLHQLAGVLLWNNECIHDTIGCSWCEKLNQTELDLKLQPCFENYKKSLNLLNEGENTFFLR
jgi:hypothetical protein